MVFKYKQNTLGYTVSERFPQQHTQKVFYQHQPYATASTGQSAYDTKSQNPYQQPNSFQPSWESDMLQHLKATNTWLVWQIRELEKQIGQLNHQLSSFYENNNDSQSIFEQIMQEKFNTQQSTYQKHFDHLLQTTIQQKHQSETIEAENQALKNKLQNLETDQSILQKTNTRISDEITQKQYKWKQTESRLQTTIATLRKQLQEKVSKNTQHNVRLQQEMAAKDRKIAQLESEIQTFVSEKIKTKETKTCDQFTQYEELQDVTTEITKKTVNESMQQETETNKTTTASLKKHKKHKKSTANTATSVTSDDKQVLHKDNMTSADLSLQNPSNISNSTQTEEFTPGIIAIGILQQQTQSHIKKDQKQMEKTVIIKCEKITDGGILEYKMIRPYESQISIPFDDYEWMFLSNLQFVPSIGLSCMHSGLKWTYQIINNPDTILNPINPTLPSKEAIYRFITTQNIKKGQLLMYYKLSTPKTPKQRQKLLVSFYKYHSKSKDSQLYINTFKFTNVLFTDQPYNIIPTQLVYLIKTQTNQENNVVVFTFDDKTDVHVMIFAKNDILNNTALVWDQFSVSINVKLQMIESMNTFEELIQFYFRDLYVIFLNQMYNFTNTQSNSNTVQGLKSSLRNLWSNLLDFKTFFGNQNWLKISPTFS